jgi:eukaryotic-like serine/threonine-protein kinase
MEAQRWQRIQAVFHEATARPTLERSSFLEQACAGDAELLAKVAGMLREDALGNCVLDRDLASVAGDVLQQADALGGARKLGRYRIERQLGEGGMGVVYLATREDVGGLVAIKLLRDSWVSAERRERFVQEQHYLATLEHPAIARLYDADTLDDGTPYFVMEYVEGEPLVRYCDQRSASAHDRLRLVKMVCEAVQYVHSLALIHRDLKPENVLVKADGNVRLLDFGIAKQLERADTPTRATRTQGARFMTPAYAAPEQLRGSPVGLYTDIYALGVILYQLLTGTLPFDPEQRALHYVPGTGDETPSKPSDRAREARSGVALSPSEWADLDVLVLTAMHPDPQRRYRSVDALLRDLDHFLRHEPLEARPDSLRYTLGKFARRHRFGLRLGAAVLTCALAMVVFFTWRLNQAKNDALAEVARTQRMQAFMKRLFHGDEQHVGPAGDLRVVTLLDRGAQEARALDRDPEVQAELMQTLGTIYGRLGRFEEAEGLLNQSLAQRRVRFGPRSPEAAESLVDLALLRQEQARWPEAERLSREALDIVRETRPSEHPERARALSALGHVLTERGSYAAALPELEAAVQLLRALGDQPLALRFTLSDLANAHFYLGNYGASQTLNRQLLELDEKTLGEKHPNVADDLINLAAIEQEYGNYPESERLNRRAVLITEGWFGADHPRTAASLVQLARSLNHEGKDAEAELLLHRALRINERVYPAVHPRISSTLNDLGLAARNQGHLDDAQKYFSRMLSIERGLHGDEHERVGVALANLATVDSQRGNFVDAERQLREALAIYARRGFTDSIRTGFARISLGRALLGQKRYAEALVESRGGYDLMLRKKSLHSTAMPQARTDIAAELTALGRDEEAAQFKLQVASAEGGAPPP